MPQNFVAKTNVSHFPHLFMLRIAPWSGQRLSKSLFKESQIQLFFVFSSIKQIFN